MNKRQVERMIKINQLIDVIGSIDRKFFNSKNGISQFTELKTTVKFIDGYTQEKITISENKKDRNFSHGGTMWGAC